LISLAITVIILRTC